MAGLIGEIAELVPTVQVQASNQQVNELFKEDIKCLGVVVVENDIPIGLVTRTNFYQKLGSLYGYNLYIGRSIELLMNKNILVVDHSTSIIDVSRLAMKRKEEELYDYVILTKFGLFAGVVSISRLLMKFAEVQTQIASYLNPLTGLPGNHSIDEQLSKILIREKFSVLYIDLDNFKTYNDLYGFAKGDRVIQKTAALLQSLVKKANGFLGHIGGDDFLAILYDHDYEECCNSIIHEFDRTLSTFYSQNHLSQNFVYTEDRSGIKRKIPLLSVSIAVVTNQDRYYVNAEEIVSHATEIKRICKHTSGSCYVDSVCMI
ncbi:GGDEF domain-containing protein [bacterium LRH843]|nr:GGDEF domain-containing protein [bacterium LRH843]